MSIHSVNEFDPTSSTPVFGSAVSQTKLQQQQQSNNDLEGAEKSVTPSQPVVNGQNDTTNNKNSDNSGNGITESVKGNTGTNGSADVHVNGQNGKTTADILPPLNATTKDNVNPAEESISTSGVPDPIEKSSQNDPFPTPSKEPTGSVAPTAPPSIDAPAPTEPEPALSKSAYVVKEALSSAPTTNIDNAAPPPGPPVETTSNDNVSASTTAPEATVLAESSATPERKTKSPRVVKAKSPAVSTPPTRQSTRSRKPVTSSSSPNEDEGEDVGASTTSQPVSSPKRTKRQAATVATDAIQASNQPTSTSGNSSTEEVIDPTDHDAIPSDVEADDDVTESKTKKKTPSPRKGTTSGGRKRGASSSPSVSASKKTKASPKAKVSTTLNDEQPMDADNAEATTTTTTTTENETVQTPPKKARTSGNKKTPSSTTSTPESSGEYVRKLRPRK